MRKRLSLGQLCLPLTVCTLSAGKFSENWHLLELHLSAWTATGNIRHTEFLVTQILYLPETFTQTRFITSNSLLLHNHNGI